MGTEIIYPIAWLISSVALILLVARLWNPGARPYALPTLVISVAVALVMAWFDHVDATYQKPHLVAPYWQYFLTRLALPAVILGLQAHLIRWLVRRGSKGGP